MDATIFLLSTTFAIIVWFWRWERSSFVRQIDRIPGPPKIPLLGNSISIPRDGADFMQKVEVGWTNKYGCIFRFWRGLNPFVQLSAAHHAEAVLASTKHINKGVSLDALKLWLGEGLIVSPGEKWRKDRKLLTPAFHFQILDGFFEAFNRNARILVEQITAKMSKQSEVEIHQMISLCTLDIICEAAMGIQIDAQIRSDSEFSGAITNILRMMQERINGVYGLIPNWMYTRLTLHGRELQAYLNIAHDFTRKVMYSRKAQYEAEANNGNDSTSQMGIKKKRAFLDLLLETARQGADMTETDIVNQIDTFMFAGHDTTSIATTWFLYCMATHQDEQKRVYEELQECFGDSDRPCTLEDLPTLKYLDCCLKESLRRHPPIVTLVRKIKDELVLDGHNIPVGASVSVNVYGLHHNEEYFPDHEAFKPERFQDEDGTRRIPFAYVPFSAGPRNCIGQKFAVYEAKVLLTTLLRKFHFSIDPRRVPVRGSKSIVLKPYGGMHLLLTHRHK